MEYTKLGDLRNDYFNPRGTNKDIWQWAVFTAVFGLPIMFLLLKIVRLTTDKL